MNEFLFGLRGAGFVLAIAMGALILWKSRQWQDAALKWFLLGLSIGPLVILLWNCLYRYGLSGIIQPGARMEFWPVANIQFRYLYEIINKVLDFLCVLAVAIGIARLYRNVGRRVRLATPTEVSTDDPRS